MSRENVEVVREQATLPTPTGGRSLEDRLIMRFPRIAAAVVRTVWQLPLDSRLRRTLVRRTVMSAWQALNRRDLDVAFALYAPEVTSEFDPGLRAVGLADTANRAARIEVQREALRTLELCFESEELIYVDARRLLSLGHMKGSGGSSGAGFDTEWAALLTLPDGRVAHEQIFLSHAQALEAAGVAG